MTIKKRIRNIALQFHTLDKIRTMKTLNKFIEDWNNGLRACKATYQKARRLLNKYRDQLTIDQHNALVAVIEYHYFHEVTARQ